MTLIVRKFQMNGVPADRLSYFKIIWYTQNDFGQFFLMDKSASAAFGHMWYEYELMVKRSEIECFMIYVAMLKLYISQNLPCNDLRNEVKRMLSEGILEKYCSLLPVDEYELLASDIKELHLD